VAATLMGFEWRKLRLLERVFEMRQPSFTSFEADDIEICSNRPEWRGALREIRRTFQFRPHFGWVGAIERPREGAPEAAEMAGGTRKDGV
jgi:hypothetical protein